MTVETESTGIDELDVVTGGLPPCALTMIVGPPGTGKTVLTLQIAMHAAREGRDVVFLSVFSEPHEKLIEHMSGFSFFDREMIGRRIELLSLKGRLHNGVESTLEAILVAARNKHRPLILLDGYGGLRSVMGQEAAQELLASLSSRLTYHGAAAIFASESDPRDPGEFPELAAADALIALSNDRYGTRTHRSLQVLKMRGHAYHAGLHGMSITTDGIALYPRLASLLPDTDPVPTGRRLCFDLAEFDEMLGGGLPQLSTTVIFGDPGTGKTTLGLHFLLAGARVGEHGLMVTFRESVPDVLRKATDLGLDLQTPVEDGTIQLLRIPPVEMSPDEMAWQLHRRVRDSPITRVVLDGIAELERAAGVLGSESDYLAGLSEYLRRSSLTTLMMQGGSHLHQVNPGGAAMPIAENRIILRRVEYGGNLYRVCSILSMQSSDHDTGIREFRIGRGGLQILDASRSERGVLAGIMRTQPRHEN